MANKQYEIAFALGGKVNASMGKAFGTANKQLANMQKQASVTDKAMSKIGNGMGNMAKFAGGAALAGGAAVALAA